MLALQTAIDRWTRQDPAALATWLNQFAGVPAFDFGAATMLLQTDGANRDIPTALAWVESIRDEELRQIALTRVTKEWAETDRSAVEKYLAEAKNLNQEQRARLLQTLAPQPSLKLRAIEKHASRSGAHQINLPRSHTFT